MANPAGLPEVCVVYLMRDAETGPEVLLGQKLTGLGAGKVVAPGGKLEPGESAVEAAVREVREEVGIVLRTEMLEPLGRITYLFPTKPEWSQFSTAYRVRGDFGEAIASTELSASWVSASALPFREMWDDARYWLPELLTGKPIEATFEFGADLATVVTHQI